MDQEKIYDCASCEDKRCELCPARGTKPQFQQAPTDSYRKSVKSGYYSSGIIKYTGADGKELFAYAKPGE